MLNELSGVAPDNDVAEVAPDDDVSGVAPDEYQVTGFQFVFRVSVRLIYTQLITLHTHTHTHTQTLPHLFLYFENQKVYNLRQIFSRIHTTLK